MLTYANYPLCIQTVEHQILVETYAPINRILEQETAGWRDADLWYLNIPAQPVPPPVRVGVLYWPTGSSRCAYFHAVINSTTLNLIQTYTDANGLYQNLVMSDGNTGHTITVSMKIARPPVPIHQIANTEQLYLVTFVDKRWDWNWKSGSVSSQPATWSSLYSTIASNLGTSLSVATVNSNYSTPSDRWIVYQKPQSILLDAVANTVGQRVVVGLDGTCSTVNYATALSNANSQYGASTFQKMLGGQISNTDIQRYVPANAIVVFGQTSGGTIQASPYTVTKTLSSLSITEYGSATGISGLTATIYGDIQNDGTLNTACANYATQAAKDWYGWHLANYDFTIPGIYNWTPTGLENFIEWSYQDGGLLTTRVVVDPWQTLPLGGYSKIQAAASSTPSGFFARLTTSSGGKWKWVALTLDASGNFIDNGGVSATFNATPSTIDGTSLCNPVAGLRVWMIPSLQVGKYEFLPIGMTDYTHPGLISLADQYLGKGVKTAQQLSVDPDGSVATLNPIFLATTGTFSGGGMLDAQLWGTNPGTLTPTPQSADAKTYLGELIVGGGVGANLPLDIPGAGYFGSGVLAVGGMGCVTYDPAGNTGLFPSSGLSTAIDSGSGSGYPVGPGISFGFQTAGPVLHIAGFLYSLVSGNPYIVMVDRNGFGVPALDTRFIVYGPGYSIQRGTGILDGITTTQTFKDGAGVTKTLHIDGGIITGIT